MNKEAHLDDIYSKAFHDELEKISEDNSRLSSAGKGMVRGADIGAILGVLAGAAYGMKGIRSTFKALRSLGAKKSDAILTTALSPIFAGSIGGIAGMIPGSIAGATHGALNPKK